MISLYHVVADPVISLKNSLEAALTSTIEAPQKTKKVTATPVLTPETPQNELIRVLERAATDNAFIARLTDEGSGALEGYKLSLAEKAALLSGDIQWIEARTGKLDEQLRTCLWCRLQQESW